MIGLNGEATFDLARLRRVSKRFSEVSPKQTVTITVNMAQDNSWKIMIFQIMF